MWEKKWMKKNLKSSKENDEKPLLPWFWYGRDGLIRNTLTACRAFLEVIYLGWDTFYTLGPTSCSIDCNKGVNEYDENITINLFSNCWVSIETLSQFQHKLNEDIK